MPIGKIHFIAGLPRSGSTLLAAILRQNPAFHASMTTPLAEILGNVLRGLSFSETAYFVSDLQRERMLYSLVESYYSQFSEMHTIFDTNRGWPTLLPALERIFPKARVICCVRSPAWILDSFERLTQHNALLVPKMFGPDGHRSVYARAEWMMRNSVGEALNVLRQAWFGEQAHKIVAVRYESLTECPAQTCQRLYELLGEEVFPHDFAELDYDEPEFDRSVLNMPGLHRITGPVRPNVRAPIIPPDLFGQYDRSFWDAAGSNPRGVIVI